MIKDKDKEHSIWKETNGIKSHIQQLGCRQPQSTGVAYTLRDSISRHYKLSAIAATMLNFSQQLVHEWRWLLMTSALPGKPCDLVRQLINKASESEWPSRESNPGPPGTAPCALTTELQGRYGFNACRTFITVQHSPLLKAAEINLNAAEQLQPRVRHLVSVEITQLEPRWVSTCYRKVDILCT